jgi:hypothetical protein
MNTVPFSVIEIPLFPRSHLLPCPIVCYGIHLWSGVLLLARTYPPLLVAFMIPGYSVSFGNFCRSSLL